MPNEIHENVKGAIRDLHHEAILHNISDKAFAAFLLPLAYYRLREEMGHSHAIAYLRAWCDELETNPPGEYALPESDS